MPNHRQPAHERLFIASRNGKQIDPVSLSPPPLSVEGLNIWQSALLAHASAKCGTPLTGVDQTDLWLNANPHSQQHGMVETIRSLLVVGPLV
jgi:hypothetical protein